MPESRIQKMQNCMFSTSYVLIDHPPIIHRISTRKSFGIFIIHIPQIIPTTSSPLRHSIGFTIPCEIFCKMYCNPFWNSRKWRLTITRWLIFLYLRKEERKRRVNNELSGESLINTRIFYPVDHKIFFFSSNFYISHRPLKTRKLQIILMGYMNKRNRFTPIPLSRKKPVSKFIIGFLMTKTFFLCFL